MKTNYYAICVETKRGRAGFATSSYTESEINQMTNLIGYVGGCDFKESVKRAGMMERNEENAFGVV